MEIKKFVGSKIREYRKKKKMNQTELGKILGVNQNTVAGYEKGDWEISYDNLFKLADLFEVSIDDFFPETKTDNNTLERISELVGTDQLEYGDMLLIKKITEKALQLEGDDRKELMNNIKLAVEFFEKSDD